MNSSDKFNTTLAFLIVISFDFIIFRLTKSGHINANTVSHIFRGLIALHSIAFLVILSVRFAPFFTMIAKMDSKTLKKYLKAIASIVALITLFYTSSRLEWIEENEGGRGKVTYSDTTSTSSDQSY